MEEVRKNRGGPPVACHILTSPDIGFAIGRPDRTEGPSLEVHFLHFWTDASGRTRGVKQAKTVLELSAAPCPTLQWVMTAHSIRGTSEQR